eukprot:CAMPEP_0115507530 /NCGR_PEP_ID=MMETSP0271-20121206/71780_1 /TAXON_ID=71861 /ORGANISM="Scrippsiella trochoidea, Strain CCMP3099" /LENGTH=30 /DNA_ID= /DNA_START= /DNA_END= /DNA_ORIENTATION=
MVEKMPPIANAGSCNGVLPLLHTIRVRAQN